MSKEKQWKYDNGTGVVNGKLCKECNNDKTCKDKKCPIYKFRQDRKSSPPKKYSEEEQLERRKEDHKAITNN